MGWRRSLPRWTPMKQGKRNKEIPPCCFSVRITPKPLSHLGALRMEGGSGAAHRPWDTASQLQYSFRTSVSSLSEVEEVEEEACPPPVAVEDRVFVAVPEDTKNGKSTLLWALENPAKDCAGVVVAHVHCPAQMIPMSKVPFRQRSRHLDAAAAVFASSEFLVQKETLWALT